MIEVPPSDDRSRALPLGWPSVSTSEQSRGKEGAEFGLHHSSQNVMSFHMIPHML